MQHVGALSAIAVVALAVFLAVTRERAIEPDVHERYAADLARVDALDHRLNEDLLRARTGRLANYDSLVSAMAQLREVHTRLADAPAYLPEDGAAELEAAVDAASESLAEEATLLERFKRENAVLQNSLRYLPVAAARLAESTEDAAALAQIDGLARDVLRLSLWNEADLADQIRSANTALAEREGLAPEETRIVSAHVDQILTRHDAVERHLTGLSTRQEARAALGLEQIYRRHHAVAEARDQRNDVVVFALALTVVVLGAAFIILRMRRAARALQQTSEQLAAAVDMKNRFVSMTSHEFRTPLSVVLSSTELLEAYSDRWKPEKKREHFDRIRGSVQSMTQLIDGILLIGRGEAGVLDFKPAPTDVDRTCRDVISQVKAKTGNQRTIDYDPPGVSEIVADDRLLRHVLDNLLTNAIKYSPDGGKVALTLRCDGAKLVLRVKDEGLGIPEADRARLFESFRRGTNVGAIPGTGLGLAVVRRAVELHGGKIGLESAVGAGTTFEISIPVERSRTTTASAESNTLENRP